MVKHLRNNSAGSVLTTDQVRERMPNVVDDPKIINKVNGLSSNLDATAIHWNVVGFPTEVADVAIPQLVDAIIDCINTRGKACGKRK